MCPYVPKSWIIHASMIGMSRASSLRLGKLCQFCEPKSNPPPGMLAVPLERCNGLSFAAGLRWLLPNSNAPKPHVDGMKLEAATLEQHCCTWSAVGGGPALKMQRQLMAGLGCRLCSLLALPQALCHLCLVRRKIEQCMRSVSVC